MAEPRGPRGPVRRGTIHPRRLAFALAVSLAALVALATVGAVPFRITHSTETETGVQGPTEFLTHWGQVGSEAGTTPAPLPRLWSSTLAAPTRLPRAATSFRIDTATAGDIALVWIFNETVGIAASTELEVHFIIHYLVGTTATVATITSYIETQRLALAAPISFKVYWDSGHATGVTYESQFEVALSCPALGTCP
jgi:hypothetical protein